jgi:hypothetical protein
MSKAIAEKLRTPDSWVGEVAGALLERVPAPGRLSVSLTYRSGLPDRLADIGASIDEVLADLQAGFVSRRRSGGNSEYFILSAARFAVFVHTELERNALEEGWEIPLAVISKVEVQRGLPHHGPVARASVTAHLPYDQAECDIADVHKHVQAWLRYERAVQQAWEQSGRLLSRAGRSSTQRSDLHAQVRRHFSALEQMIELLQQRSEKVGTRRARGFIVDRPEAYPDTFRVRASRRDRDFGNDPAVQVSIADQRRPMNLELVAADNDEFYVSLPEDARLQAALAPGTLVELTYKPRFSLGRHSYALGRLLREEVEGDWESLARLVSDPGSLWAPAEFPPLARYFNERLNTEQRQAVAGAVQTPHAYFVQGPPGTGKTTVICEIVRQLVARGERVLLLAPMHVAVDEVLERVGDADGVLALRASYDDSKVREELRRFTKDRLTAEFVRKARRPESAKSARWVTEAHALRAERELITACLEARHGSARAQAAWREAVSQRDATQARYRDAFSRAGRDRDTVQRAMVGAQARLIEAERAAHAARQARSAAESAGSSVVQRIKAAFGAGELARLRSADRTAELQLIAATEELQAAMAAQSRQAAATERLQRESQARNHAHAMACARAANESESAEQKLAMLRSQLDDAGLAHEGEDELARRARLNQQRETRLGHLAHLEDRWFQLTGLAGTSSPGKHQQIVSDLGDQLIGAANLICCTTTGFGGDADLRDTDYDTLIVDEASRVIDSEFLIGAKQASRWLLVGDEHQLPPHVDPADEHHLHALAALHMAERGAADSLPAAVSHLSQLWREDEEMHQFRSTSVEQTVEQIADSGQWHEVYRPAYQKAYDRLRQDNANAERELLRKMRHHLVQSIFERCVTDGPEGLRGQLIEQRRMIDPIAALVRDPIYAGRYLTPPPEELGVQPLTTSRTFTQPVVFLDTSGYPGAGETQEGTGCFNELEAAWVADACRAWDRELAARGERNVTVSVLTFYKAQARKIRERLGAPKYPGFRVLRFRNVDTIDRLQGQESDLIVISFCRAKPGRQRERPGLGMWLQDVRRLNVACTRAKRAIVLVGHRDTLASLRGIPAAESFYAHMFELFSERAPGTVLLKQLEGPGR